MAVPSSGAISMVGVSSEISQNTYNPNAISLTSIALSSLSNGGYGTINTQNPSANRPNGSAPHNLSEFYSYDHDFTTNDDGDEKKK